MMVLSPVILPGNQQKGMLVGSEKKGIDVYITSLVNMLLCRLPENTSVYGFSASLSLLLGSYFGVNN